jgi:lipopolysaccharide export system protein LptC
MPQKLLLPLIVAVIAGLSAWLLSYERPEEKGAVATVTDTPDSFVEDVVSRTMDKQGYPRYELRALRLDHYRDDNRTEVQRPYLTVFRPGGRIWTVAADTGTALQNGDEILLHGQVVVRQPEDAAQPAGAAEVEIRTREVVVWPQEEFAETDQPATLVHPEGRVQAVGLHAYFRQERLQLLSQVRGEYEPRR